MKIKKDGTALIKLLFRNDPITRFYFLLWNILEQLAHGGNRLNFRG